MPNRRANHWPTVTAANAKGKVNARIVRVVRLDAARQPTDIPRKQAISTRFVKNVKVVTFKDVNVEELAKSELQVPET